MSDSNTVEMREFYLQFSTTITPPSTTLPKNLNSKWFSIWFFFNSWWNISSLYILWLSLLSKSIEIRVYYFNESVFVPRTEIPWGWFNSVIVYVYTTIFFSLVFSLCRSSLMFLLSSLFSICNVHTISPLCFLYLLIPLILLFFGDRFVWDWAMKLEVKKDI